MTAAVRDLLEQKFVVKAVRHFPFLPSVGRRSAFVCALAWSNLRNRPVSIIYEHVDLASAHSLLWPRVPYVVMLHGTEVWRPLEGRRRKALCGARLLVSNSRFTEARARDANPWLPRVVSAHLGVAVPDRAPKPLSQRDPVVVMLGRLSSRERYKGHDEALEAWPEVRKAFPGARLVIIGDGDDLPRLRAKAAELALEGVDFVGRVADAVRDEWLGNAQVLLAPSRNEGFGLVVLEGTLAGAVVVGLRGTVLEELFDPGELALAQSQSPKDIAAEVIARMTLRADSQAMVDRARARVLSRYTKAHFQARFRGALVEVLP